MKKNFSFLDKWNQGDVSLYVVFAPIIGIAFFNLFVAVIWFWKG